MRTTAACSSASIAGIEHKFNCNYCHSDVTDIRVKCADADCPDFDLCLQCFACGAEIGLHKKNHKYQVVSDKQRQEGALEMPLFKSEKHWKAKEELELLSKVTRYGMKNWEDVASIIGTKPPKEMEEHFVKMYIEGNIGRATLSTSLSLDVIDHTEDDTTDFTPCVNNLQDIEETCQEIKYKPLRDDFDEDYDSKAELEMPDVTFSDNEDEDELHSVKLACIDIYRNRLLSRYKVKKMVNAYQLVKNYHETQKPKPPPKEKFEREENNLREQLKVYCRLTQALELEALIENVLKEKRLKLKIKELTSKISKLATASNSKSSSSRTSSPAKVDASKVKSKAVSPRKSKENKHKKSATGYVQKSVTSPQVKKETKSSSNVSSSAKRKRPAEEEKDLSSSLHCLDLLSGAEKKVCSNLDIEPSCYMALKMVLLKERNIMLDEPTVKTSLPPELNKNEVKKITKFMVNNGWIAG